jgi:hypothetical protein
MWYNSRKAAVMPDKKLVPQWRSAPVAQQKKEEPFRKG